MYSVIPRNMSQILWKPAWWSLTILCLLIPPSVVAQELYGITGTVLDAKTMTPVPDAVVLLTGTLYGLLTESDGSFGFADLFAGQLTIVVSADGYVSVQKSVTIQKDMHLSILLVPQLYEQPDQHIFPGPSGNIPDQLFRSILPWRQNAGAADYTLHGSSPRSGSIYLDDMRILDVSSPLLTSADLSISEVITGPYRPDLGMEAAIRYRTDEQLSTGTEIMYDSRRQRIVPALRFHHMWSHGYTTIHGVYDRADHYADGSGTRQISGIQSGSFDARIGLEIAPGHRFYGHGGWMRESEFIGQSLHHQAALITYRYSGRGDLLHRITVAGSHQEMVGGIDQEMQSGFAKVHLAPMPNLHLKVGADYYRVAADHTQGKKGTDGGVFMAFLYQNQPVFTEMQLRLDPFTDQWGGASLLTWQFNQNWQLIAGVGRAQSDRRRPALKQVDIGVRWTGLDRSFELMTFARETAGNQVFGLSTYARGAWWRAVFYTTTSHSRLLAWGKIHATVSGPFDLFILGSELYGSATQNSSVWLSTDLWMQSREIQGISLRVGVKNIPDGTYTYPSSMFAEPGRSFLFLLSYRHSSSGQ